MNAIVPVTSIVTALASTGVTPDAEGQDVEQHDVGDQADAAHQPEGGQLRGQAVAQDARDEGHRPEGSPAPALWLPGTVRTGVTDRLPA
jgi:hypothetical protein